MTASRQSGILRQNGLNYGHRKRKFNMMFKPLSLYIGLRYTRAKKRNHFISFISMISMIGIALGVLVLITVLSVMNGFDDQIQSRILAMVPQVTVTGWDGELDHWQTLEKRLQRYQEITGMAPMIQGQAMVTHLGQTAFGVIEGIKPQQESQVSPIANKMLKGSLASLKPGKFHIVLGKMMAENLGAVIGSKVTVYVPQATLSPVGTLPRLKQFTVSGIFQVGYQFDNSYALVNLQDASKLLMMRNKISGIQLKLKSLFSAPRFRDKLMRELPMAYHAMDWTQQNANFFKALKMEKSMMFLILLLIIIVAAFNMLSSLVMVVTDKQADIAILRTLGLRSKSIIAVFMVQGTLIGLAGTLIGLIGGIILSLHVTELVNWIQTIFHVQFLSSSVYYIDFVPSELKAADVIHVCIVALIISVLATLYPAWRASKIQPAEALRYE